MKKHLAEKPADIRASPVSDDILEAQKREHKSQLEVMERSLVSQAQLFNELASLYKDRDKEVFNHRQEVSSLLQSIREDQAGVNKLSERISKLESQVSKVSPALSIMFRDHTTFSNTHFVKVIVDQDK